MSHTPVQAPAACEAPLQHPRLRAAVTLFIALCIVLDIATLIGLLYYHHAYHDAARTQIWSLADDRFGDFWHYHQLFALIHTQQFFESADRFAYPAPCAVIYDTLYHAGPRPFLAFVVLLLSALVVSAALLYRMLRRAHIAAAAALGFTLFLCLTSYPWEKLFDRANLELFVYIFLAAGVWAFLRASNSAAAAFWGIAGALKIYPLVMLVVFFRRRELRALAVGLCTCAATLLASFWFVGPTVHAAALGSLHGITGFVGNYAAGARIRELTIDHSLLGAIKELLLIDRSHTGDWSHLSSAYQLFVVIAGAVLYLARIRRLPVLNQLCLCLIAITLLPPVSYDYTLVHIYLVFGIVTAHFLTQASFSDSRLQGITTFAVAFALIFCSQGWMQTQTLRFNGVIKCAALLTLCWLILTIPLSIRRADLEAQPVS